MDIKVRTSAIASGRIDLMQLFCDNLTPDQLEFVIQSLQSKPILPALKNDAFIIELRKVVAKMKISGLSSEIEHLPLEFKEMLVGILEKLVDNEKKKRQGFQ